MGSSLLLDHNDTKAQKLHDEGNPLALQSRCVFVPWWFNSYAGSVGSGKPVGVRMISETALTWCAP